MKKKPFLTLCAAAAAVCALMVAPSGVRPAVAATPPPTPPPMTAPVSPSPAAETPAPLPSGFATPAGYQPGTKPSSPAPSGTPTPQPDNRKGIEGVWEVAIQRAEKTEYTHFTLKQDGSTLSGSYSDHKGVKYPLAGTVDGQAIRLLVSMPDGTTILLEGRLDGTTDMIGMMTTAKEQVPFTAGYRPKEKWIENVNPSPGGVGLPSGGGIGGGGGGGYPPRR